MLTVTKIFEFHYAHFLPDYPGKCKNLHGHCGVLEVEVARMGKVQSSYDGMVMDFGDLKRIVNVLVISKLDHSYLNDLIEVPTAENIAEWIWGRLFEAFGSGLIRVRVYETSTSYAEIKND